MSKIGLLLTNTGTPDAPTPNAVRAYLREFLSDKHVVQLPRIIWLPILYGLVLPLRPKKSVKFYQKIWTTQGSPMRFTMEKITTLLQNKLNKIHHAQFHVEMGMNYGNPSIPQGLNKLRQQNVDKIIILPLYPQYSHTTTASTFHRVANTIKKWSTVPEICLIRDYADNEDYIRALASSAISRFSERALPDHLLISFHGIPERYARNGDPYKVLCEKTAYLIAEELKLPRHKWSLCFQSQFGYDKWLKPSTQRLLVELPKQGYKNIDIICPGFPVDCLETLEEIALTGTESFLAAGGESLRYIPALNDSDAHINLLTNMIVDKA